MIHKILLPVLIVLFISGQFVYSQAPAGGAAGTAGPAGGGIPPPIRRDGIVIPREDLNQFENSTLRERSTNFRQGQSTLNPSTTRKSNAEVNADIEKSREERNNALEEEKTTVQTTTEEKPTAQDDKNSVKGTSDFSSGSSTLFRWTDKDGNLHVTDNLGSVPPEYRDQAYNSK